MIFRLDHGGLSLVSKTSLYDTSVVCSPLFCLFGKTEGYLQSVNSATEHIGSNSQRLTTRRQNNKMSLKNLQMYSLGSEWELSSQVTKAAVTGSTHRLTKFKIPTGW